MKYNENGLCGGKIWRRVMVPVISVVLGSYNRKEYIPLTINSIHAELTNTAHEIIVVDGGSTDGTLEWLLGQKDIITIVQHNRGEWQGKPIKRRSWGYFMNLAFKCAQGKYVCMVSDDCVLVPGAIRNGLQLAESEQEAGKKIGAVAFYWREWSKEELYHVGHTLGDKLYVNHGLYLNSALRDVDYIDEETYFFYSADGDLCLKLWHKGYEVIASPTSFVEHYPHANVTVRATNYETQKADAKNYLKKWEGIFYDPVSHNVGRTETRAFVDIHSTAENFLLLHNAVIKAHPEVLKKKSMLVRAAQRCGWIGQVIKRRLMFVRR